ncbi:MAG: N-6 DNA methylase, partial [Thaumarchaeota archaeon]|nr:N-6 DNA methylase [Nitrososphaerota archaeon]
SMDDEKLYGKELHRLGFGEAVERGLLSDYKVMVLAVDENTVSKAFQIQLADESNELSLEDAVKIIGCWNGLAKRGPVNVIGQSGFGDDLAPMEKAVAFSRSIKDSKRFTKLFAEILGQYPGTSNDLSGILNCEVEHVDGTFNVLVRNEKLAWLKEEDNSKEQRNCRILSNAKCLSEGVDVPALDAVLFLNPRDSMVDVVQSVGRVMRKVPEKQYGYIILPVGIPTGVQPEQALKDNKRYKVVWDVLQALRAHDDRFDAHINKLDLNKGASDRIQVIGVGGGGEGPEGSLTPTQLMMELPVIEEWRNAIYAKVVEKCGSRKYWETWATDVAHIAERQRTRITSLLANADSDHRQLFEEFLEGLRENINPSISESDAIEMLSQHLITKPVFDALFDNYSFTQHNPVSASLDAMIELLEDYSLESDTLPLEKFYESVRSRAKDIDNAEGKQRIVIELYDKFFKTAFPKTAEALGIVYTPIEVVDFIIKSADAALRAEFGASLSDPAVHILVPFTGTGTFIVRLLQSGLIKPEDLETKYSSELHANEIVLLAYYIAAINIEETYHALNGGKYRPFEGIVLTDTFQMSENQSDWDAIFPDNSERAKRQKAIDIRVIVGNPPYSVGQGSQNANNKNLHYDILDKRIETTYAAQSMAGLKRNLYDSYIRAFRWVSDRIGDRGVICFVSNGYFLDSNAMDGLRKTWADEFSSIYIFNLRGNQRTAGETSRKEGGKIFGSGSRTPIAITLIIKHPVKTGPCKIFYRDIGDYLTREQKLEILHNLGSTEDVPWEMLVPSPSGDWINQRNATFEKWIPLGDKKSFSGDRVFSTYSLGAVTNRDAWAFNFSGNSVRINMARMIEFYNSEVDRYRASNSPSDIDSFVDPNPKKISWTVNLKTELRKGRRLDYEETSERIAMYRPFCKQHMYFNRKLTERVLQIPKLLPEPTSENLVISVTGVGSRGVFSSLISDVTPNLALLDPTQCFPRYYFDKVEESNSPLYDDADKLGYTRREAITDRFLDVVDGACQVF